mmetsp:Transcript_15367/g.22610  ORF Transcript_15367/g.22610 Transcript_15367/m.22610 type:complete len:321 (+) Transcript_15367:108-1070(+)|eukprot:CAMPEP_0195517540 /NCGR_PEP_ID=MMETSP0794_2-20130614/10999_1 /TAXON_ID=515487 /ORGANISM="Stephanopyxis turris, Strain CCMP 815" /LENGTH=320 /DNA_ID=CAMNT_0040646359 /DNA_START=103 /DNA_END=1065 /DNA_ORIENTATION=-
MNNDGNPYDVLGVPSNASIADIKKAYRKLAIRNHPDKVTGGSEAKARASQRFAQIGAAYEILSDEGTRKEYDRKQQMQQMGGHGMSGDAFFSDFSSMGGHHRDPFSLFEEVFGRGFASHDHHFGGHKHGHTAGDGGGRRQNSSQRRRTNDPFDDPFFTQGGFGGGMGGMGGFPGMGGMMGGMGMMDQMMQQMHQQHRGGGGRGVSFSSSSTSYGGGGPGGMMTTSYSSSSTSYGGPSSESVTTTTQIVNGKRVTRTERTLVRPDGTVEKHVETSGDGSSTANAIEVDSSSNSLTIENDDGRSQKRSFFRRKTSSRKKDHD